LYHSTLGLRVIKKKKDLLRPVLPLIRVVEDVRVLDPDVPVRPLVLPARCHVYIQGYLTYEKTHPPRTLP